MPRHLYIYDRGNPPKLIHEFPDVRRTTVTAPGVLVVDLPPIPGGATRIAIAPGHWGFVAEHDSDAPAASSPAAGAEQPTVTETPETLRLAPPVVPGKPTDSDLDAFLGMLGNDAMRVHAAMQIPCTCHTLRCGVILNPATRRERADIRKRGFIFGRNNAGPPLEAEPLRQCVREAGHPADLPCYWREGDWPYGPSQHHPKCPRNPQRYNRAGQVEGQPSPAGITTESAHAVSRDSAPADAPTQVSEPVPSAVAVIDEPTEPGPVVRPYVTALSDRPDHSPTEAPYHGPFNWNARANDPAICATYDPTRSDQSVWCTRPKHLDGQHACEQNGGAIIYW